MFFCLSFTFFPIYGITNLLFTHLPFYFSVIDISESEITGNIRWINSGSEAAEYGVEDFSAESILKLVDRMETDDDVFNKYYARTALFHSGSCNAKCKKNTLCEIRYPDHDLHKSCKKEK